MRSSREGRSAIVKTGASTGGGREVDDMVRMRMTRVRWEEIDIKRGPLVDWCSTMSTAKSRVNAHRGISRGCYPFDGFRF